MKRLVLRLTSVIRDKTIKINEYVQAGVVDPRDAVGLAISLAAIAHADLEEVEYPSVRAVFPIGDFYLSVTPYSDERTQPRHRGAPGTMFGSGRPLDPELQISATARLSFIASRISPRARPRRRAPHSVC